VPGLIGVFSRGFSFLAEVGNLLSGSDPGGCFHGSDKTWGGFATWTWLDFGVSQMGFEQWLQRMNCYDCRSLLVVGSASEPPCRAWGQPRLS